MLGSIQRALSFYLAYAGLCVCLVLGTRSHCAAEPLTDEQKTVFFEEQVKPILSAHCFKCHGAETKLRGELRLTSREGVLQGGELGPAVDLEQPEASNLVEAINYEGLEMPPDGKLPSEQVEVLTKWIELGLPWSRETEDFGAKTVAKENGAPPVDDNAKKFWAFQVPRRPVVPEVEDTAWVNTPIDAFVLARLEAAGLKPSRPSEKAALLRRAYYDLIGLPPSPEAIETFLSDDTPQAFERVVNELLESPHYGERWGRHWLDLVRYAESNSYERDGPKPFVWRYRDYVIRSLNEDKPYDQFVMEQLAGDELGERTPDRIIATGYYRLGRWQDEPVDPLQELYEDLDDIVTTTGQVFLGLTINCARCHDHKLDPLPQRDYYRFLAFFHGLNRYGERSAESVAKYSLSEIALADEQAQQQAEIERHRKNVADVDQQIAEIERLVYDDFQDVEKEEFKHEQHKIPLVKMRVPNLLSQPMFARYVALKKQQRQLGKFRPSALSQALSVSEMGREPRETFVLIRGSAHAPGEKVAPGFPAVLSPPEPQVESLGADAKTCGRRLALARWIASPDNPLTARVMANRIWQYHFGRGIVASPNNFGFQGTPPTHPELLDWLASEFVDGGWRLKRIHKLIMLSHTYQMSSRPRQNALTRDPQNDLFWRFDMRRLEAEEIRDSILAVIGRLNPEMYGPSIYPAIPQEVLAGQSMPGANWEDSSDAERARRSIYIHTKRSLIVPLIAAFDGADPDATCPVRFVTTQPTQALGTLNGEFLHGQARIFADYLRREAGAEPTDRVELALRRVFQRKPTEQEVDRGIQLMESLKRKHNLDSDRALDLFCLVSLNLNEFIYLD